MAGARRVHERYCIDHKAEFNMHEIVENVFTRAAKFMHDSSLRMNEDHVGNDDEWPQFKTSTAGFSDIFECWWRDWK